MKRFTLWILCAVLLLTALGAQAETTTKYVEDVTAVLLDKANLSMYTGRTAQLVATVKPASRVGATVTWRSENKAVATVDENGKITALKAGYTTITASCETKTASCAVTVTDAALTLFTLNANSIYLAPGDTFLLEGATYTPDYAADKTLTFESGNPLIAQVDATSGLIRAMSLGDTTIVARANSGGATRLCTVHVVAEIRAQSVLFESQAEAVSFNRTLQLTATAFPANCVPEDKVITYVSSNPSIASIDANGLITTYARKGKTLITATTANGRAAQCTVTVQKILAKSVEIEAAETKLRVGESTVLTATVKPANATKNKAVWRSANPAIASVDENGRVTALSPGIATIRASAGAQSAIKKITVESTNTRKVTISAAGDITIGGDPRRGAGQMASLARYEQLYTTYNGRFLNKLADTFSGANELTIVNLESTFTSPTSYRSKSYIFRANPAYAHILSDASVEVVGHANNHAGDFTNGISHTRSAVTAHSMAYAGNGVVPRVTVNGVKVGVCAFSTFDGTSVATVRDTIKRLSASSDLVVASFHWGTEMSYGTTASMRSLAHTAVIAGADLVIGHHQHVVSGIEKYRGKYIVYGLGTLSSAVTTPNDMDTFVYQQTFEVDAASGTVYEGSVKLVACTLSTDPDENNGKPDVLTGANRKRVLSKIKSYSSSFAATLPDSCFQ